MIDTTGSTKTIVVITGASGGIGSAVARALAGPATEQILQYHSNRSAADETLAAITQSGSKGSLIQTDLGDDQACRALVDQAWAQKGRVDCWIHAAGADVLTGPAASWSYEEKLRRLWEVDVLSTVNCCRWIGEMMAAGGGARSSSIVTIGWDQADQGMEGMSGEVFATAKGAVAAFTRSLAQSLTPHVRVNCVSPGWIRTAWGASASADWQKRATQQSLAKRWGTPEDVAKTIAFLTSDNASFINGQILHVNGGFCYYP